jgi:hypothetical protein
MVRIDAQRIAAEVIELKPFGYFPHHFCPQETMGVPPATGGIKSTVVFARPRIRIGTGTACPNQAVGLIIRGDVTEKSLCYVGNNLDRGTLILATFNFPHGHCHQTGAAPEVYGLRLGSANAARILSVNGLMALSVPCGPRFRPIFGAITFL